jgi:hypothetical protein
VRVFSYVGVLDPEGFISQFNKEKSNYHERERWNFAETLEGSG